MRTPAAFLTVLLALTAPAAAIPVAERIPVEAGRVTLADLVPDAPEAWDRVALGRAPRPGGERRLSGAWILSRARQVDAEDVLQVPESVVLTRAGTTVGREDVVRAVTRALAERLGPEERARVTAVGLPGALPRDEVILEADLPDGPLPSPATVWVDAWSAGSRQGRAWARVEFFRSEPVVTLVRDVRRGEVLTAADLEVRSGDAPWGALVDPAQAVGQRLVRSLRAGTGLRERDVEALPVVARGDTLRVVARVGGVTASTLGRALEAAGVGEALEVENLASGRRLTGVLREGGVVDVGGNP